MSEGIFRIINGKRECVSPLPKTAPRFDAAVLGGGTAGAVAAVTLAEKGFSTLLIERGSRLGGVGTQGGFFAYYYGTAGGKYEEIDREVFARQENGFPGRKNGYNAEWKAAVLEEKFLKAGGKIAFRADLTGALMRENRVVGVEYCDREGVHTVFCRVAIDASASAALSLLAGAKTEKGRALDGVCQPYSAVQEVFRTQPERIVGLYCDCGFGDPDDPEEYAEAVMAAAKYALYFREDFCEGDRMIAMAPCVGIREGARIRAEERVSFSSVTEGRQSSENVLFTAYSNADNHGKDTAFESEIYRDWMVACSLWGLNFAVKIPAGALIPEGIGGLLAAGRILGVDHDTASAVRQMRDMQKCGEAAALLAAAALRSGADVRDVPYGTVKSDLLASGCLSDEDPQGFTDSKTGERAAFPETPEAIRRGLASRSPGMAMWAVRGGKGKNAAREMLKEKGDPALHAAMALALAGDAGGGELLLERLKKRDARTPETSRKFNVPYAIASLYLLGKIAYLPALTEILKLIRDPASIAPGKGFLPDEFIPDEEDFRFQIFTHAAAAAFAIAKAHPETEAEVREAVQSAVERDSFTLPCTLKGKFRAKYEMAPAVRGAVRKMAK